jgi:hypothetical protein
MLCARCEQQYAGDAVAMAIVSVTDRKHEIESKLPQIRVDSVWVEGQMNENRIQLASIKGEPILVLGLSDSGLPALLQKIQRQHAHIKSLQDIAVSDLLACSLLALKPYHWTAIDAQNGVWEEGFFLYVRTPYNQSNIWAHSAKFHYTLATSWWDTLNFFAASPRFNATEQVYLKSHAQNLMLQEVIAPAEQQLHSLQPQLQ